VIVAFRALCSVVPFFFPLFIIHFSYVFSRAFSTTKKKNKTTTVQKCNKKHHSEEERKRAAETIYRI